MRVGIWKSLKRFRASDDGAVTVDWVVLTAGIVGLAVAVMIQVGPSVAEVGDDLKRCQRIAGNIMFRDDDRSYAWRLSRIERRCSRL